MATSELQNAARAWMTVCSLFGGFSFTALMFLLQLNTVSGFEIILSVIACLSFSFSAILFGCCTEQVYERARAKRELFMQEAHDIFRREVSLTIVSFSLLFLNLIFLVSSKHPSLFIVVSVTIALFLLIGFGHSIELVVYIKSNWLCYNEVNELHKRTSNTINDLCVFHG